MASLAAKFTKVIATDVNQSQLYHATKFQNVSYIRASAEHDLGYREEFDLITTACALHWFECDRFFEIANLSLKENGVFCAWTYEWPWAGSKEVDRILSELKNDILKNFWLPESELYLNHYRDVKIPFKEFEAPRFTIKVPKGIDGVLNFLSTWSPVIRYRAAKGSDPLSLVRQDLQEAWRLEEMGDSEVSLPLYIRVGTKG